MTKFTLCHCEAERRGNHVGAETTYDSVIIVQWPINGERSVLAATVGDCIAIVADGHDCHVTSWQAPRNDNNDPLCQPLTAAPVVVREMPVP